MKEKQQKQIQRLNVTATKFFNNKSSLVNLKIERQYLVTQKIGGGAFGQIYKARDLKNDKIRQVALKLLSIQKINKYQTNQQRKQIKLKFIEREDQIMNQFDHPNILPCYNVYANKDYKIIVTKYCNQGNLAQMIKKYQSFDQEHAIFVLHQISMGLSAIHNRKIVHRDLKPQNIFIHNGKYIIGDFGLSKAMDKEQGQIHTICGTPNTQAPQIVTKNYTLNVDIYSLGMILFAMLYPKGQLIERYKIAKQMDLKTISFKTKSGRHVSKSIISFLQKSLQKDPNERMNWQQLQSHLIFRKSNKSIQQINLNCIEYSSQKHESKIQISQNTQTLTIHQNLQLQSSYYQDNTENKSQFYSFISVDEDIEKKEQYYSNFIQSQIQIQEIFPQETDKIKEKYKNIQDQQTKLYNKLLEFIIYLKRTQFIFKNIIEPIQKQNLLNLNIKSNIEVMYILSTRCFFNLSKIKYQYQQLFSQDTKFHDKLNIQNLIKNNYIKSETKLKKYSQKLTNTENSWIQIAKNRMKIIFSSQRTKNIKQIKDIILNGNQKIDFNQYDHIQWIQHALDEMRNFNIGNEKKKREIIANFKAFREVNHIKVQDLKGNSFENVVENIIWKKME